MARDAGYSSVRWRLHGCRLGSFLAGARAVRDLADDARSKYRDDFVFDRQYVVSLVERALEHLDGLVFDARVVGAGMRPLEAACGRCAARGRGLLAADLPAGDGDEPEYALLSACADWLDGGASGGGDNAMAFVRQATDALIAAFGADRELAVSGSLPEVDLPRAAGRLRLADLGGAEAGERRDRGRDAQRITPAGLRCRPLGLLLAGAAGEAGRPGDGRARWLAVADRRHLSLRRESGPGVVLEASLVGDPRTDWVFVYSTAGDPPEVPGLRGERTERGWVVWDSGAEGVEQVLVGLGARLFAPA